MILLFPVFFPMLAAALCYLLGRRDKQKRDLAVIACCGATLLVCAALLVSVARGAEFVATVPGFCGFGLSFELDGFRALYALIGGVMWLATSMLSRQYFAHHYHNRNRYYFFFLMTLGATLGVFLSSDLFTTFIFFEVMSFTSYTWVAHDETPGALRAAETYLAVAIIGGMVMLVGLFLLKFTLGTLVISELHEAAELCENRGMLWACALCILFGFGAKAGMFPLHIWLPKAHPVAPAPASALLSGILTKTGVFGVIVVSANIFREDAGWGNLMLVLGLVTMLGGAVLAVFSVNLKRTLACSSMSQIGFILTGIAMSCLLGEENALAARGALLYMLNHSLFKLVLFMAAGVVYMNLHKLHLNDVRGFGRGKPLLHFAFLRGAFGLMGVPLFSGYVSKTLIHEGIVEYAEHLAHAGHFALPYNIAEWVYLFSGGLTGAYMIKLYICLFWDKHPTKQFDYDNLNGKYMNGLSALALTASAALVPLLGVQPNLTMDAIADFAGGFLHAHAPEHAVTYFSLGNLKGACISLTIGALVYLFFIRRFLITKDGAHDYADLWPARLDIEDRVYRPLIGGLLALGGKLTVVANEANVENAVYWPLVRLFVKFGGGLAALGSEQILEDMVYWPLIRLLSKLFGTLAGLVGSLTDLLANLIGSTVLAARTGGRKGLSRFAWVREHHIVGRIFGVGEGLADVTQRTTHSMSYGLLLMGLGLCVTLIYLLIHG